jgi:hypothetical protein
LRAQELAPRRSRRRGAGPKPERLKIDLIVVAPTLMPSLRNSLWIRTQPQLEFSRASRNTSSRLRPDRRRSIASS